MSCISNVFYLIQRINLNTKQKVKECLLYKYKNRKRQRSVRSKITDNIPANINKLMFWGLFGYPYPWKQFLAPFANWVYELHKHLSMNIGIFLNTWVILTQHINVGLTPKSHEAQSGQRWKLPVTPDVNRTTIMGGRPWKFGLQ